VAPLNNEKILSTKEISYLFGDIKSLISINEELLCQLHEIRGKDYRCLLSQKQKTKKKNNEIYLVIFPKRMLNFEKNEEVDCLFNISQSVSLFLCSFFMLF
jgi:hypothetical protein